MLCINAFLACCSCCICILTMLQCTRFLSTQSEHTVLTLKYEVNTRPSDYDDVSKNEKTVFDLIVEFLWTAGIVLLFVIQHSLMASQCWKGVLNNLNIVTCERALYVIATCWTLQLVMSYLEPLHLAPLWYISTSASSVIWFLFFLVHSLAWILLYATCIIMDFPEMIGIRQVYYQYLECSAPIKMKSAATRRLYGHMRHGGATCLLVILWIHPLMTSTRFVLAAIFSLFLICGFTVCEQDYVYLREQLARKRVSFHLHQTKSVELLQ